MIRFKASFDDGCELDLKVADLLEKYGFDDATFYIPSDWHYVNRLHGDIPLTKNQLEELAGRFQIGSHTVRHPMLTRIPDYEVYHEVIDSKQQLEQLLHREIDQFCYPRGYANDNIRDLVRKHYASARNTLVGYLAPGEDPAWEHTTVHVSGKRRKEYEGTTWQDEGRRLLDIAVERSNAGENVTYHFWGHSWEIERHYDWGEFEIFLQSLAEVRDTKAMA